jgi:endoglucanase
VRNIIDTVLRLSCCAVITALTACGGTSTGSTSSTTSATGASTTSSTTTSSAATSSATSAATGAGKTSGTTTTSTATAPTPPPTSSASSSTTVGTSALLPPTTTSSTSTTSTTTAPTTGSGSLSIKVSGNHLVDGDDNAIQLRGVNLGGLEGIPWSSDPWRGEDPDFNAIKSWGINVVRFTLSEANWLGLCSQTLSFGETPAVYLSTIQTAVAKANALGIYVILDLHYTAVPNTCPQGQNAMADVQYSPTFWSQVAAAFKNNPAVMFELFNEPQGNYPPTTADWNNYVKGGLTGSQDVGTQQLLTAIRSTGATNVVLVDGLDYAATFGNNNNPNIGNDQSPGLILPTDTLNPAQLAAAQHYYNGNKFETGANALLAKGTPILVTEYGDDVNATTDPDTTSLFAWADPGGRASQALTAAGQNGAAFPGVSYVAWVWAWGGGWYGGQGYNNWSLVEDANGTLFSPSAYSALGNSSTTPTAYALEVHSHYLCREAGTISCP